MKMTTTTEEGAINLDYVKAHAQFHNDMAKSVLLFKEGYDPRDYIGIDVVAEIADSHPPCKFTGDRNE